MCANSEQTLNTFLLSVNQNIKNINDIQTFLTNTNNFINNANNTISIYTSSLSNLNKNLTSNYAYKSEVFYYTPKYSNNDKNNIITSFGTISNTGKLVKIYFFLNIYASICFGMTLNFEIMILNFNRGVIYTKYYDLSKYKYTGVFYNNDTCQFAEKLANPIQVYSGYTIGIKVFGSYTCTIETSNIQALLNIDTSI